MRDSLPAHPLFPAAGEEPPPRVEYFYVTRWRDGKPVWCPHRFLPDEMDSLEPIQDRFGGGHYELVAYAGGKISAKRSYSLEGRQRPMKPDEEEPEAPPAAPVAPTAPNSGGFGDPNFMLALLQMMQASSQESAKGMMSIVAAVLSRPADNGVRDVLEQMQRSSDRQMEMFLKMLELNNRQPPATSDALKLFKEGLAQGLEMGTVEEGEGDEVEQVANMLTQVKEGFAMAAQAEGSGNSGGNFPFPTGESDATE